MPGHHQILLGGPIPRSFDEALLTLQRSIYICPWLNVAR